MCMFMCCLGLFFWTAGTGFLMTVFGVLYTRGAIFEMGGVEGIHLVLVLFIVFLSHTLTVCFRYLLGGKEEMWKQSAKILGLGALCFVADISAFLSLGAFDGTFYLIFCAFLPFLANGLVVRYVKRLYRRYVELRTIRMRGGMYL